ncbi:Cenp-O kinetochore centromere component-domain-containing protein [Cadophora sp. MPI-SDFR-AT-0126]|nr:Cenp-O kinetochore centromere component-domain-containing protein [Leotiomycetes sp. MPI-SDFR-AT-0126]
MLPSTDDTSASDAIGAQLDEEISSLQAQISSLKSQRKLQAATILSSRHTKATLTRLRASQKSTTQQTPSQTQPTDTTPLLLAASTAQRAHTQENLYRACAGITTFRVQDPDPSAVDGGNVLGIRIDVSSTGKFIKPYYIMLNKPWAGTDLLRIHRHTVPASIPLSALAERYLPHGKGSEAMGVESAGGKKQDLRRFVRALRREVVAYHNRTSVIKGLRREFKLDEKESRKGKGREKIISDISAADAEAKQVRIEWVDGRIGRAVVDEKGEVVKCVVIGEDGRDGETERRLVGGGMEGIGERLREGMY